MNKKNTQMIVVAILIGLVDFGLGTWYGKSSVASTQSAPTDRQFTGGNSGQFSGTRQNAHLNGGMVSGEILSKDAQSITIKDRNGGSRVVFLSNSSQVLKSTPGTLDDLTTGLNVTALGTGNADGSVTAQTIQIRPAGSFGGGQR